MHELSQWEEDGGTPERVATVNVDGRLFTGRVYHVRENGWPCIETDNGHIASGPEPDMSTNAPFWRMRAALAVQSNQYDVSSQKVAR